MASLLQKLTLSLVFGFIWVAVTLQPWNSGYVGEAVLLETLTVYLAFGLHRRWGFSLSLSLSLSLALSLPPPFCNCIILMGFLPSEIRIALPGESQLRQSRATQPTVHAGCFRVSIIRRTLTWTTGSLTCAQM